MAYKGKNPDSPTFLGMMYSNKMPWGYVIHGVFNQLDLDELKKNIDPKTGFVAWYLSPKKTMRKKNSNRTHFMALAKKKYRGDDHVVMAELPKKGKRHPKDVTDVDLGEFFKE